MSVILAFVILCIAIKGPPEPTKYKVGWRATPLLEMSWLLCLLIPAAMILVLEKGWPL